MSNEFDFKMIWNDSFGSHVMEYLRIFDFTDDYEEGKLLPLESDARDIMVTIFGKRSNTHKFDNVKEAYDFCMSIMK